jgi:hypothetical protein
MPDKCTRCGRTESQIIADAKTLGLLQEFESGLYSCCQISEWAEEQCQAWFEALAEDDRLAAGEPTGLEIDDSSTIFVPVPLRRKQVPWYRSPEDFR